MKKDIMRATPFLFVSLALLASGHVFRDAYGLDVGLGSNTSMGVGTPTVGVGSNTKVGVDTPAADVHSQSDVNANTNTHPHPHRVQVIRGDADLKNDINNGASVSNRGSADTIDCPPSNSRNSRTTPTDCMNNATRLGIKTGVGASSDTHSAIGVRGNRADGSIGSNSGVHVGGTTGVSIGH